MQSEDGTGATAGGNEECSMESAKCRARAAHGRSEGRNMRQDVRDLCGRMEDFAVGVIKLTGRFERSVAGRHVAGQLMRSGTSAGANYEEACGGESRADLVHKLQVVL